MNIFNRQSKYPASEAQAKERMSSSIKGAVYIVLALLIGITGFHAVMIILSETAEFTFFGQTGAVLMILTIFRLGFPLLVELAAAIHIVGAVNGVWKSDQKSWGGRIDLIWLLFAVANMVTFFAIERGMALESWQVGWLTWGLPVSGIIAGRMVISMLLADPAHKRAEEDTAAHEEKISREHTAESSVRNSEAMKSVQVRKAWRDYANTLRAEGYDEYEIDFILSHVPELQATRPSTAAPRVTTPARPSLMDRARSLAGLPSGGDGIDVVPLMAQDEVSQNTHTPSRHDSPVSGPVTEQGEGDKPNGKTRPNPMWRLSGRK